MTNTPFGVNLLGSLLQDTGFHLNPVTSSLVGTSHTVSSYTPGTLVAGTCLRLLTYAINDGYVRGQVDSTTYGNLIAIGSSSIPALGNSKPPTYSWIGPANASDPTSTAAQAVSWYPYTATATTNVYPSSIPTPRQWSSLTETTYSPDITQWGWIRLFALQAWNEFNYNGSPSGSTIVYKDFLSSFQTCSGFLDSTNQSINVIFNALTYLKNTYSNNNDLMTADVTGVNLATYDFGKDLIALGKAIDLKTINTFGLPSNLLKILQKYSALTASVSYAIISTGMTASEINDILNGQTTTNMQEQQLYGAFSIITDKDLENVLIPLNCSTTGLTSLIDLLNPIKLFPNSYASLTVPVYNSGPGPTNAKTYYQIYVDTGVNSQLSNPNVIDAIGPVPLATLSGTVQNNTENFQVTPTGFGAYTRGIIPDDVSIASGAFSYSMQQITNIFNVPIEKFAQVVANLETTNGLPLTAGTNVPTNITASTEALNQIAYGSGPNGTFTMSDFFGCMTGLPYQWTDIKNVIQSIETSTLYNIYKQLYLAVTWERATVSVQYTTYTGPGPTFDTYYHVTGLTITDPGGGYGREGGSAPTITISNGGSGTTTIGTSDTDITNFGRVTTVTLTSSGTDGTSIPTATVGYPPGGTSFSNSIVQGYIDNANTEISSILASNPTAVAKLNRMWGITGTQLTNEQRARDIALEPVPSPRSNSLGSFPATIIGYVNSVQEYGKRTEPHMHSQTIEAITDNCSVPGQSQIALMRTVRNSARLISAGIPVDNIIPQTQNALTTKILMGNGTVSTGKENQGVPAGDATFTIPADPNVLGYSCAVATDGANQVNPIGHFENDKNSFCVPSKMNKDMVLGSIPYNATVGQDLAGPNIVQVPNPITPVAGGFSPQGECNGLVTGKPMVPGSLGGSPYQNIFPPQLSIPYISGIVTSPTYTVADAIDEVVRCNCDCWLQ